MGCKGSLVQVQSPRPFSLNLSIDTPGPCDGVRPTLKRAPRNILVCNDDGIRSEGILALADALRDLGTVYVVAPDRERSAAGHSLTLTHPLRVEKVGIRMYAVDGTPTDCVNLAVNGILRDRRIALVASGINKGANMGDDITYSGTVSAAMEGTLLGIPSIAVSLASRNRFRFEAAARFTVQAARKVLRYGIPRDILLNVNLPNLPAEEIRGVRVTCQGKRVYGDAVVQKRDPRGRKYFWIGGDSLRREEIPGSDLEAVEQNYISVTPIHLDMTHYASMRALRRWKW
jgi:5'-nucleotidase